MSFDNNSAPHRVLGVFALSMICVSAIISLRNLPITALQETKAIFFYGLTALLFFIPIALSCAELASAFPKKGGIYMWVKEAFGSEWGVFVIWMEWIGSVVWLPGLLIFLASTTGYLFSPLLQENKFFLISLMLFFLWSITLINLRGLEISSRISEVGVIIGSLLPAAILIGLGLTLFPDAIASGRLDFSLPALLPSFKASGLVTFTALMLGFAGMEIPAYYVQIVKDPKKTFPRALFLAAFIILTAMILGSLAISAAIPKTEISLVAGTLQAFQQFFEQFGITWAVKLLAACMLIGGLALLNTWIIGPSRGLLACAEEGDIPALFKKTNARDVPVTLLLLQAIIGTALITAYMLSPSINAAFWILNTLAAQLYLLMYAMVFLAVIKLRYKQPHIDRPYQLPGGKIGLWSIAGVGALACLGAILVGLSPSDDVPAHINQTEYAMILIGSIILCALPPFVYKWVKS